MNRERETDSWWNVQLKQRFISDKQEVWPGKGQTGSVILSL